MSKFKFTCCGVNLELLKLRYWGGFAYLSGMQNTLSPPSVQAWDRQTIIKKADACKFKHSPPTSLSISTKRSESCKCRSASTCTHPHTKPSPDCQRIYPRAFQNSKGGFHTFLGLLFGKQKILCKQRMQLFDRPHWNRKLHSNIQFKHSIFQHISICHSWTPFSCKTNASM